MGRKGGIPGIGQTGLTIRRMKKWPFPRYNSIPISTDKGKKMRIALDAMGTDHFPHPDVEGAVAAAREYGEEILLIGKDAVVLPVLEALKPGTLRK
jgi:hypothetical protein